MYVVQRGNNSTRTNKLSNKVVAPQESINYCLMSKEITTPQKSIDYHLLSKEVATP